MDGGGGCFYVYSANGSRLLRSVHLAIVRGWVGAAVKASGRACGVQRTMPLFRVCDR